jgi:choline kinase
MTVGRETFTPPTRAIILAAGRGTRLRPHTDDRPKCLVEIAHPVTILQHQLRNCRKAGLEEAIVVTGFGWRDVEAHIDGLRRTDLGQLDVRTIHNPFFDRSNNLISLWAARHVMAPGFILINGDDVFDWRILERLAGRLDYDIHVCIDKKAGYDLDDMKVTLRDDRIREISKTIDPARADGESIGILRFSRGGAARLLSELEQMVRFDTAVDDWYLRAVERIALSGYEVGAVEVNGLRWAEIDFPQDLEWVRGNLADLVG